MPTILLLFDSRGGLTEQLADAVAEGVRATPGVTLRHRRLDDAGVDELKQCAALILGSPNWSGVTGKLKDWMDNSGNLWETGELAGKIGAAFTAGWARSGGTEATLLQLLHLLFAHGMLVLGLFGVLARAGEAWARGVFVASIVYLPALFALLLL